MSIKIRSNQFYAAQKGAALGTLDKHATICKFWRWSNISRKLKSNAQVRGTKIYQEFYLTKIENQRISIVSRGKKSIWIITNLIHQQLPNSMILWSIPRNFTYKTYPICKLVRGKMHRPSSPFPIKNTLYALLITQNSFKLATNVSFNSQK